VDAADAAILAFCNRSQRLRLTLISSFKIEQS
jgi:hypothetical protein